MIIPTNLQNNSEFDSCIETTLWIADDDEVSFLGIIDLEESIVGTQYWVRKYSVGFCLQLSPFHIVTGWASLI